VGVECFFAGNGFEVFVDSLFESYLKDQAGIVIFLGFYFFSGFCCPGRCFSLGIKCAADRRVPLDTNGCCIISTVFGFSF
jgi:hypothetical protein